MRAPNTRCLPSLLFFALTTITSISAQATRPSQHALLRQSVGATEIEIEYSRPVARGRELFGALVPWGKTWNPGADSATRVQFSSEVQINGHALAAGEYSLWAIPDATSWTIIFSRAAHVFHTPYPAGRDALRFSSVPQKGEHMETLAWYFPMVDGLRATLHLHWGTTVIPMMVVVPR